MRLRQPLQLMLFVSQRPPGNKNRAILVCATTVSNCVPPPLPASEHLTGACQLNSMKFRHIAGLPLG
jgi:hypothetical protein